MHRIVVLALALALVPAVPAAAQDSTAVDSALQSEVMALLRIAPLNEENRAAITDSAFMHDAALVLLKAPVEVRPVLLFESVNDVIAGLEELLALSGSVSVTIVSKPEGSEVWYRKSVEVPGAVIPSVTANDTSQRNPGWYDFWTVHPRTGERVLRTRDCSTSCLVEFNFEGEP